MDTNKDFITETETGVNITLSKPLMVDGATMTFISMREPTVEDQMAMDATKGTDAIKEVTMMANLCMLTVAQMKTLRLRDYKRVQVAFTGFID